MKCLIDDYFEQHPMALSYLGLTTITIICIGTAVCFPAGAFLRDLGLNLGAGLIGSGITLFLIDGVIRRQENERTCRFAYLARKRLQGPLNRHISLWGSIYKATAAEKPARLPSRFSELLSVEHISQMLLLDGLAPSPCPTICWADYLHAELLIFINELEDVVDKFGFFVEAREIESVNNCTTSNFVAGMKAILPNMKRLPTRPKSAAVFMAVNEKAEPIPMPGLQQHLIAIETLLQHVTKGEPSNNFTDTDWSNIVAPKFGSARLKGL